MKVVTNAMLYDCYPRLKLRTLKRLACFPSPPCPCFFSMTLSAPLNGLERPSVANALRWCFCNPARLCLSLRHHGRCCSWSWPAANHTPHSGCSLRPKCSGQVEDDVPGFAPADKPSPTSFHFTCREQSSQLIADYCATACYFFEHTAKNTLISAAYKFMSICALQ
jgi:hypothetical protein